MKKTVFFVVFLGVLCLVGCVSLVQGSSESSGIYETENTYFFAKYENEIVANNSVQSHQSATLVLLPKNDFVYNGQNITGITHISIVGNYTYQIDGVVFSFVYQPDDVASVIDTITQDMVPFSKIMLIVLASYIILAIVLWVVVEIKKRVLTIQPSALYGWVAFLWTMLHLGIIILTWGDVSTLGRSIHFSLFLGGFTVLLYMRKIFTLQTPINKIVTILVEFMGNDEEGRQMVCDIEEIFYITDGEKMIIPRDSITDLLSGYPETVISIRGPYTPFASKKGHQVIFTELPNTDVKPHKHEFPDYHSEIAGKAVDPKDLKKKKVAGELIIHPIPLQRMNPLDMMRKINDLDTVDKENRRLSRKIGETKAKAGEEAAIQFTAFVERFFNAVNLKFELVRDDARKK